MSALVFQAETVLEMTGQVMVQELWDDEPDLPVDQKRTFVLYPGSKLETKVFVGRARTVYRLKEQATAAAS